MPFDPQQALKIGEEGGLAQGIPLFKIAQSGFKDPEVGDNYFFCARTCQEIISNNHGDIAVWDEIGESNVSFVGTSDDGMYEFRVADRFRDGGYRGASGAPIFNSQGHIVSLLSSGSEDDGALYGTPIRTFLTAMGLHI